MSFHSPLHYELVGGAYEKDGSYYRHILKPLTNEVIDKEKITYDEYKAINKLSISVYPTQFKNYTILKIPDLHKHAGKYVSVDHLLNNIILNLWCLGIETFGTDQGNNKCRGYICINHNLVSSNNCVERSRESALLLLEKTFGKENVRISHVLMKYNQELTRQQKEDFIKEDKRLHSNKIYFDIKDNFIAISFEHKNVSFINSLFKNDIQSDNKCYKGRVFSIIKKDIIYDDFI